MNKNIICCIKVKESYVRITNHFINCSYISFEESVSSLEDIKDKSTYKKWQYAIVDKKLGWYEEAVKFFKKNNIDIIYFDDDYQEVIETIKKKIPEEEEKTDSSSESSRGSWGRKIKYIEKIVDKKVYTGMEKKLIIVANLTRGAGATTITLNLAKYLSSLNILTAVLEPPIGSTTIFNCMGIEGRLEDDEEDGLDNFYSYPHEISEGSRIKNKAEYIFDNIVWIVPDDRKKKIENWKYDQMLQLVYISNAAPITLIDVGGNLDHVSVKPLLSVIDSVLVIVDPFPTICKMSADKILKLLELKEDGCPINFIINKWNSGIEEKTFLGDLGVNPVAFIPAIDLGILYRANYNYEIAFCCKEVAEILSKPLKKISSLFVPKEFIGGFPKNKNIKKRSLFADLLGKFVKLGSREIR